MSGPQTSYNVNPDYGPVGAISRNHPAQRTKHKLANGIVYPGRWVVYNGDDCAHPSAAPAAGSRGGIALRNPYGTSDGVYADNTMVDVLEVGYCWVDPEVSVTRDTKAYARYVTPTTENKGDMRNDSGGATGGITITAVTAVNAGTYTIAIKRNGGDAKEFSFIADASATTAEIATGLAAAIDADAGLVATNPTSTTVLVVGTTVTDNIEVVTIDSRLSYADNEAAFECVGAYFRTTASTGVVELELGNSTG